METTFTPLVSLAGGLLIGLSAVMLMVFRGRIMGATGILDGLMLPEDGADRSWRVLMLAGMVTAPVLLSALGAPVAVEVPISTPLLILGGLIVGFGAALGSGCTSGHGVCGLARLSPRSAVATATFMAATLVTVYVIRHVIGA